MSRLATSEVITPVFDSDTFVARAVRDIEDQTDIQPTTEVHLTHSVVATEWGYLGQGDPGIGRQAEIHLRAGDPHVTSLADHLRRAFSPVRDTPGLTPAEAREAEAATKAGYIPTPGALSAIDAAWYTRLIGLPDAARAQALNAYTIASAVAAALLGAALLVKLDSQPTWVRVVGIVGIGTWPLHVWPTFGRSQVRSSIASKY